MSQIFIVNMTINDGSLHYHKIESFSCKDDATTFAYSFVRELHKRMQSSGIDYMAMYSETNGASSDTLDNANDASNDTLDNIPSYNNDGEYEMTGDINSNVYKVYIDTMQLHQDKTDAMDRLDDTVEKYFF